MLQRADGSGVVLEMNDTACGLMFEHEEEDNGHIRDLVLARMQDLGEQSLAASPPDEEKLD